MSAKGDVINQLSNLGSLLNTLGSTVWNLQVLIEQGPQVDIPTEVSELKAGLHEATRAVYMLFPPASKEGIKCITTTTSAPSRSSRKPSKPK